jgi:VanZ family protein
METVDRPTGETRKPGSRFDIARLVVVPRPLLLALIVVLASLVVFASFPPRPIILHVLQKLAHPTVFGVIAVSVLVLELQRAPPRSRAWFGYLIALAVAVGLGGLTEILQNFTHRDPSLRDVGLDARGALCALALTAAFDRRLWTGKRPRLTRAACASLGIVLAVVIYFPLGLAAASYANRHRNFPVLFTPASRLDLYFIAPDIHPATRVELTGQDAGRYALLVPLIERPYAGVTLFEPSPDWRGYSTLVVDLTNPGSVDLKLIIRVHDRHHNGIYADRYNADYSIPPGTRRVITTPLAAIESAPRGRSMDMAHIAAIMLFRTGAGGPPALLLNEIALQ